VCGVTTWLCSRRETNAPSTGTGDLPALSMPKRALALDIELVFGIGAHAARVAALAQRSVVSPDPLTRRSQVRILPPL